MSVGDRRVLQSLIELMVSDVEKVRENGCLDVAGLVVFLYMQVTLVDDFAYCAWCGLVHSLAPYYCYMQFTNCWWLKKIEFPMKN